MFSGNLILNFICGNIFFCDDEIVARAETMGIEDIKCCRPSYEGSSDEGIPAFGQCEANYWVPDTSNIPPEYRLDYEYRGHSPQCSVFGTRWVCLSNEDDYGEGGGHCIDPCAGDPCDHGYVCDCLSPSGTGNTLILFKYS